MPKQDRNRLQTFRILPILGRKTNVPQDDPGLFQALGEGVALSHDVGGHDFDLWRQRNACSKSFGYSQWSTIATHQATKCLGLFELYDGTNRSPIFYDNGKFNLYTDLLNAYEAAIPYDAGGGDFTVGLTVTEGTNLGTGVIVEISGDTVSGTLYLNNVVGTIANNQPITDTSTGTATTNMSSPATITELDFAANSVDLYSTIRVGAYALFSDRGEHRPYRWKYGDHYPVRLVAAGQAGENYQFRYIDSFQRRVLGLYETTAGVSNGNISIRWSDSWPTTAITALTFPAGNHLYVPNDDPIVGGKPLGQNQYFIYSDNSIHQLAYYADYTSPFRPYTVVPGHGAVNHHSIVFAGNRHFLFNAEYGFCEYRGGAEFPSGGKPISENIEADLTGINFAYYNRIVGVFVPAMRRVVWIVPWADSTTPNRLLAYDIETRQWTIEEKTMRYIDVWQPHTAYTWNTLISDLGGAGATWDMVGSSATWSYYTAAKKRLVYANTNGHLYTHASEAADGSGFEGWRHETVLDFGNKRRKDILSEIWFDIAGGGNFSIDVYHRGGDTVQEITGAAWSLLGSISCDSPDKPFINLTKNNRLHQIRWGTDRMNESFSVNGITFRYMPGQEK